MNVPNDPTPPQPLADQNVERLLNEAYQPESPDAEFAGRVRRAMQAAARERRREAAATPSKRQSQSANWRSMAMTTLTLGVILAATVMALRSGRVVDPRGVPAAPSPVAVAQVPATPIDANGLLTPREARPDPKAERLSIGETIATQRGQRRRVALPDGSVLFINQNTTARLVADRHVRVESGEVFVEVSPRGGQRETFLVETPDREVTALGTKFSVGVDGAGTNVLVVQGKVKLDNLAEPLVAGERWMPQPAGAARTAPHVSAAPRASHLLDWTEPLMAAARSPLVPRSEYAGGSLTAVDPDGQETKFSLRKYHVDVHIEDGFARTTIDQTYFNHLDARLEGTFRFPLPPDASISRLAMYVGENLMEGGMVERDYGRQVFESIKYRMLDPALLEWVDGSTFKMRVFPLEGRQEKRIILSYTQRLESLYGRTRYRFPAGHSLEMIGHWSLHVRAKNLADADWSCDTHKIVAKQDGRDLVLESEATNVAADCDVVLDLISTRNVSGTEPRFSSARHEGSRYLMVRYRPQLGANKVAAKRPRRDWIVLFESSADRDPLLARAQVEIVRTLLDNAEHDDTFCIVTANTRPRQLDEPRQAKPANVAAAIGQLEQTHLVGALDLEQAFGAVRQIAAELKNPVVVHVGSGTPVLGERDETKLRGLLPTTIQYVGIGVGKHWNRGLMKSLAARSGGYFTHINPDEAIGWQAFDLLATLNTPRLVDVRATDPAGKRRWLAFTDALADGEEFCAVTRVVGNRPLPKSVVVTGSLDGRPFERELTVANVSPDADYLPRQWAKLEIDRLVADDAAKHRDEIVALSKSMYVMSPFTSLLVLENEAMYAQYHVDRGRNDHWALYPCPEKIEVVHEPMHHAPTNLARTESRENGKTTARDVLKTMLAHAWPAIGFGNDVIEWSDVDPGPIWLIQHQQGNGGWSLTHHSINQCGFSAGAPIAPLDLWNGQFLYRLPGRINLNTAGDPWIWEAINAKPGNNVATAFALLPFLGDRGRSIAYGSVPESVQSASSDELVPYFFGYSRGRSDTADFDELIRLIQSTIDTDSWEEVGGPGSVAEFETNLSLIIKQTWDRDESGAGESISPEMMAGLRFNVNRPFGGGSDDNGNGVNDPEDLRFARTALGPNWYPYYTTRGPRDFFRFDSVGAGAVSGIPDQAGQPISSLYLEVVSPFDSPDERYSAQWGFDPINYRGLPLDIWVNGRDENVLDRAYYPPELFSRPTRSPFTAANLLGDLYSLPPIVYPSAEVWEELTFRRSKYASVDLSRAGSQFDFILDQLDATTCIDFDQTPLAEVVDYLKEFHGIEIQLDAKSLDEIGIDGNTLVTKKLAGISLRSALKLLLKDLHPSLTYFADRYNGVLQITVKSVAERKLDEQFGLTRNLLSFAPGVACSWADVRGVLDQEVSADQEAQGTIDPRVHQLFAKSRQDGWRKFTSVAGKMRSNGAESWFAFDGQGRLRIDRTTADGLRETVICDGETLWHVYPEFGVAARRELSRWHRAAIAARLPWLVPPDDDLAHGANVRLAGERMVDVVPIGEVGGSGDLPTTRDGQTAGFVKLRLVFAKDGRLLERQWIEMPSGKRLLTMQLNDKGAIAWLDGDGKELHRSDLQLVDAAEPDLKPRVENLAVVPMPLRTVEHLVTSSGLTMSGGEVKWTRDVQWTDEQATAAIAAACAQGNVKLATQIMCYWFYDADRADWQASFYRFLPLLASAGVNWAADAQSAVKQQLGRDWNPLEQFPDTALGRFLVGAETTGQAADGFVESLSALRRLLIQLQTAAPADAQMRRAAIAYVKQVRSPDFAWSVLTRLRVAKEDKDAHKQIAEAYASLADVPAFSYAARYERAAHLHSAGLVEDAQKVFLNLVQETFDAGLVPRFDKRLPDAFDTDDPFGGNPFGDDRSFRDIILRNARKLAERHTTLPLVRLSWQCRWVGQESLADELIGMVVERVKRQEPGVKSQSTTALQNWVNLAVLHYYWATEQPERADAVLAELLNDQQLTTSPNLWLLGAEIADGRGRLAEAADRNRKALDLAYGKLEGTIDVEAVRRDFGALLDRYEKLARAIQHPSAELPAYVVAAVVGAADRWRALEVDVTEVCRRTANILSILGADQLAWDYATTTVAGRGAESAAWTELAQWLSGEDSLELADRAFETAYEMEPTNADILWQHGQMLEAKGHADRAAELYRQIVDRDWQPRFSGTKSQAQHQLDERK